MVGKVGLLRQKFLLELLHQLLQELLHQLFLELLH
jgi:hypothetical protein